MPQPEDTFNVIRTQLEAVGLKIKPTADQWDPDYLDKIQGTPDHGIHLLGWTGDYNDTDNFVGVFFGAKTQRVGLRQPGALRRARARPAASRRRRSRTPLYEEINEQVMEFLPGVPLGAPGAVAGVRHQTSRATSRARSRTRSGT